MRQLDLPGYLARLGLAEPGPPSVAGLHALHRAHVEKVPYENLEIQLNRPTTIDPIDSAERIIRDGRGGYCYHLNGAFAALLGALGFQVRWHVAGVQNSVDERPPGANGNHLALTVRGLPDEDCPAGVWFVDAGLGDALHDPLPLRHGTFTQGPFTFGIERSPVVAGGWRFAHDPTGSFARMDFAPRPAGPRDFLAQHHRLSTSPESSFVRVLTVQRRHSDGVDILHGCVLTRRDRSGRQDIEFSTSSSWFGMLADIFGLTLDDVPAELRRPLWRRVLSAHEAWISERDGVAA
jgi:arylamine N-acetyltransferase